MPTSGSALSNTPKARTILGHGQHSDVALRPNHCFSRFPSDHAASTLPFVVMDLHPISSSGLPRGVRFFDLNPLSYSTRAEACLVTVQPVTLLQLLLGSSTIVIAFAIGDSNPLILRSA
ncbi:hypothetical protein BJ546DRAFT_946394 [Cryomyces antarcticus]